MKLMWTPSLGNDTYKIRVQGQSFLHRMLGIKRTQTRCGWDDVQNQHGILSLNPVTEQMHKGQRFASLYDPRSGYEALDVEIVRVERPARLAYFSAGEQRVLTHKERDQRRRIDMRELGEPTKGDCARAAIATCLGLAYEQVPDFIAESKGEVSEFWEAIEVFLDRQHLNFVYSTGVVVDCLCLASGKSPRGVQHMVVMYGSSLYHDPHPSRAGLLSVENRWYLMPQDPILTIFEQPVQLAAYTVEQLAIMCEINLPSLMHI